MDGMDSLERLPLPDTASYRVLAWMLDYANQHSLTQIVAAISSHYWSPDDASSEKFVIDNLPAVELRHILAGLISNVETLHVAQTNNWASWRNFLQNTVNEKYEEFIRAYTPETSEVATLQELLDEGMIQEALWFVHQKRLTDFLEYIKACCARLEGCPAECSDPNLSYDLPESELEQFKAISNAFATKSRREAVGVLKAYALSHQRDRLTDLLQAYLGPLINLVATPTLDDVLNAVNWNDFVPETTFQENDLKFFCSSKPRWTRIVDQSADSIQAFKGQYAERLQMQLTMSSQRLMNTGQDPLPQALTGSSAAPASKKNKITTSKQSGKILDWSDEDDGQSGDRDISEPTQRQLRLGSTPSKNLPQLSSPIPSPKGKVNDKGKGRGRGKGRPPVAKPPPGMRRARCPWTDEELEFLRVGLERFGPGNWADILHCRDYHFNPVRTSVDLKDKYRVMCKGVAKK